MDDISLTFKPEEEDVELGDGDDEDVEPPGPNEIDLFDTETRRCSITCRAITVQPAKQYINDAPAALIVLVFTLHPERNCRFSFARISCEFKSEQVEKPRVSMIAPQETYGGHSEEDKSWTFGLETPLQIPGGIFSITPNLDRSVSRKVHHYLVIRGSRRGTPPSTCVWTMEENADSKAGLPMSFATAIVLKASEAVDLQLNIKSTVFWKWFPRTMATTMAAPAKIKLSAPVGRQFPLKEDLDELKIPSWFTGGLDGSVHKWPFEIVHP